MAKMTQQDETKPTAISAIPPAHRAQLRDRKAVHVRFTSAIQFGPGRVGETIAIGHQHCTAIEEDNRGVTCEIQGTVYSVPWCRVMAVTRGE